jgi:hypothetical protein
MIGMMSVCFALGKELVSLRTLFSEGIDVEARCRIDIAIDLEEFVHYVFNQVKGPSC